MSKMPIDLSKFRKIHSDPHTSTLQHPDGHQIKIAHKSLTNKMRSQLDKLPMASPEPVAMAKGGQVKRFDDGGDVPPDYSNDTPEQIAYDASKETPIAPDKSLARKAGESLGNNVVERARALGDVYKGIAGAASPVIGAAKDFTQGFFNGQEDSAPAVDDTSANEAAQAPLPAIPSTVTQPPANPDPFGSMASMQGQLKGIREVGQGQQMEQNAVAGQGLQNITAEQKYQDQQAQNLNDYNAAVQPYLGARAQLMDEIQLGQINPKHYVDNMTTGGRIASTLGLILGGMGAGLTHGPNLAFQALQDNINRDIDAQKVNLGKKESLLSANFKETGNLRDAYNLTQLQTRDLLSSHLRQINDQTTDPMAKARIMQIQGQVDQQTAQMTHQMAMQKMMMGAMNQGQGGQGPGVPPVMAIKMLAPEKEQPALLKDLETKQNMDAANKDLMQAFDYVAQNNTLLGKLNPQNQSRLNSSIDSKLLGLAHASAGRFNMEEIPYVKGQFPSATDDQQSIAFKRQQFAQNLAEKAHFPSLEPYGVRSGFNAGNAPAAAQSSQKIRTDPATGFRYMRGPNGEAVRVQ